MEIFVDRLFNDGSMSGS